MLKEHNIYYNHKKLLDIYESLNIDEQQISFTTRGIDDFQDGTGSIFKYNPAEETDWNDLHPIFKGTYLEEVYNDLKEDWILGRGRFMRMDQRNRALSYHYDNCTRLHIPLMTNPQAMFLLDDLSLGTMHELGKLYELDATKLHSAMNLSWKDSPRVHIVISVFPKIL